MPRSRSIAPTAGAAPSLTLHQNGKDRPGTRVPYECGLPQLEQRLQEIAHRLARFLAVAGLPPTWGLSSMQASL